MFISKLTTTRRIKNIKEDLGFNNYYFNLSFYSDSPPPKTYISKYSHDICTVEHKMGIDSFGDAILVCREGYELDDLLLITIFAVYYLDDNTYNILYSVIKDPCIKED
jgi:hypothetical protein